MGLNDILAQLDAEAASMTQYVSPDGATKQGYLSVSGLTVSGVSDEW